MSAAPLSTLPAMERGMDPGSPAAPAAGMTAGDGGARESAGEDVDLTGGQREHVRHVLRLFVTMRVALADVDLKQAPAPVRAVAGGRWGRLADRDLWTVAVWVGLTREELMRAARRACGEGRS